MTRVMNPIHKFKIRSARSKISRMEPEDITAIVEEDWEDYVKWRDKEKTSRFRRAFPINDGLSDFLQRRRDPLGVLCSFHPCRIKFDVVYMLNYGGSSDDDREDVYYGMAKTLITIFMIQLGGSLYSDNNFAYNLKTIQLIYSMWMEHRASLEFNKRETGLLIRSWLELYYREIGISDYNEMIDGMLSETLEVAGMIERKDKATVMERLESLKRDSDVVNGSKDAVKIRDLVGMVHDSSTELIGKAVDQ